MLIPSKILYQNINKFVWKYLQYLRCSSAVRNFTAVIFSRIFSIHYKHLRMFVINFFFSIISQARIYSPCLFFSSKTQMPCTFFPANWLLSIVIDKFVKRNSYGYCFRRFRKFPRQYLQWSFQESCCLPTWVLLIIPD